MKCVDLDTLRSDTPGCAQVVHLNHAGASLPPRPVLEAVISHLRREAEIGGYEAAAEAGDALESTYVALADLIGSGADEIAVVENATRAWDMAFYGIPFGAGDRILTATAEYASNFIAYLQMARRTGVTIDVVPDDEHGQLDVDALREMMDGRVKLIAITHVPTSGGLVNPAEAVGQIARDAGCLYLLDACQSVGQLPLSVNALGCDFLSATGRKYLRGPRGTGFLYARREALERVEPPLLDLHAASWVSKGEYRLRGDARRFENWETNVATKIGLGVAARYAISIGPEAIWERVATLGSALRTRLEALPGVTVRDRGRVKCGIVTFTVEGKDPAWIQQQLRERRINVSVSVADYTRIDMEARRLTSMVRASVHYYNSEAELDLLASAVEALSAETMNRTQ
ncbi:MAG: aminotransferase class V-fold PLP-dependent enzyme [Proteobacteria bacterium]|nr:aminotransferase class V-fold PLP-dependent enzyme [Pseudomonadota bacterium]